MSKKILWFGFIMSLVVAVSGISYHPDLYKKYFSNIENY